MCVFLAIERERARESEKREKRENRKDSETSLAEQAAAEVVAAEAASPPEGRNTARSGRARIPLPADSGAASWSDLPPRSRSDQDTPGSAHTCICPCDMGWWHRLTGGELSGALVPQAGCRQEHCPRPRAGSFLQGQVCARVRRSLTLCHGQSLSGDSSLEDLSKWHLFVVL